MHTSMLISQLNFVGMIQQGIDITERIRAILAEFDVSLSRLSTRTGVHLNTLRKLQIGETKNISDETVKRVCEKYPIRYEYLKHGTGEMLIGKEENTQYKDLLAEKDKTIRLLEEALSLYKRIDQLEKENEQLKAERKSP